MERSPLLRFRAFSHGALALMVSAALFSCADGSVPSSDRADEDSYNRAGAAAPEAATG
ncbi:MAG: hypothetical protein ACREK3_10160 [Gemmatimonadota bacterium]